MRTATLVLLIVISLFASHAYAQSTLGYIHLGSGDTGNAAGIGLMFQGDQYDFGFEISSEGDIYDRTNRNMTPGLSMNGLVGIKTYETDSFRFTPFVVIGFRESEQYCEGGRRSNLGYQCFADESPSAEYEGNFGGGLMFQFSNFTLGVRATDINSSVVLGLTF